MADLTSPTILWLKGFLFLLLGTLASVLLLARTGDLVVALLLGIAVWAFCRAYYFAFYVIEHYVDSSCRFAGLWAFVRYMLGRRHHND